MLRPSFKHLAIVALAAGGLTACGKQTITLDAADKSNAGIEAGAQIFADRCAGCHTLAAAGTQGSATKVRDRERTDGPNFNVRPETKDAVLYAIHNGGFSGAIMPENIVVGQDAQNVAAFIAKYAGRQAKRPPAPNATTPAGGSGSTGGAAGGTATTP